MSESWGRQKIILKFLFRKRNTAEGGSLCIITGLVVVTEKQRRPSYQSSKLQVSCRSPSVVCDMVRSTAEESALISLEFMFLGLCSSITIISLKIKLDSD